MQQQGRLHYLDALRSFCMLYGVFVHTGAFLGADALPWIGLVSKFFRMETFFVVSGFLVAAVAARAGVRATLRRRSVALLVPLATVAILLNPLTFWLIHLRQDGPMSLGAFVAGGWREPTGVGWLLHLWFLVSLWVFVMLFPLLGRVAALPVVRRGMDGLGRWSAEAAVPLIALATAGAVVALRVVHDVLLEPLVVGTPFYWVSLATLIYLPYFALGVLMHASPAFRERMHRVSLTGLGLGVLLVAAERSLGAGLPPVLATVAAMVAGNVLTVAIVAALLGLTRALVPTGNRLVTLLIDSIYTVYLLHYVVIYALGLLLLRVVPAGPVYYLLLSPVLIGLLVAFHRFVVARSPLLRFLLNGRMPVAVVREGAVREGPDPRDVPRDVPRAERPSG